MDNMCASGEKPSETLPFHDLELLTLRLMEMGISGRRMKDDKAGVGFTCGSRTTNGPQSRPMSKTFFDGSSSTIAMADVDDPKHYTFAEKLINGTRHANEFWSQGTVPGGSNTSKQIFDEALMRSRNESDLSASASFGVAQMQYDNLHLIQKGIGIGMKVYRRSERYRFQRYPIFQTSSSHPLGNQWQVSPFSADLDFDFAEEQQTIPAYDSDLVLMMSHGVTDNLYLKELNAIVGRVVSPTESENVERLLEELEDSGEHYTWTLPQYIDESSRKSSLRFATSPSTVADLIIRAARHQLAHGTSAGPSTIDALFNGDDTDSVGHVDGMSVVACWLVKHKDKATVEELWESGQFTAGEPPKRI